MAGGEEQSGGVQQQQQQALETALKGPKTAVQDAGASTGDAQAGKASSGPNGPDPAAKDATGWPLLHRVVMAAATGAPAVATGTATATATADAAASTNSSSETSSTTCTLQDVLAVCKDVNIKGPGGFTALHLACLGALTPQQRK